MNVSEAIQKNIPSLSPKDTLENLFLEDFPVEHLYIPVVEDSIFKGFFDLTQLELNKDLYKIVAECDLEIPEISIKEHQHLFEILPKFQRAALPILPVFAEDGVYEGVLTLNHAVNLLAEAFAFQYEGGVLVLEVKSQDYSLSEISRLIESNQAKVLAAVLETSPYSHELFRVHLKISEKDLNRIVATLERFGYHVSEVHHQAKTTSLDKERLDQLMKYLGI